MGYTELDRELDTLLKVFQNRSVFNAGTTKAPAAEETIATDSYKVVVPMLGVAKEDLVVKVENHVLRVTGTCKVSTRFTKETSSFSWTLAEDAAEEEITASLKDGLLTVVVPRITPEVKTVNIQVN